MRKFIKGNKIKIAIFVLFVISRLPSLGHDGFNTDVWKWKTRSYDFGSGVFGLDFKKTDQKYHPGVTLMWLGSFSIKAYNFYTDVMFPGETAQTLGVKHIFGLHFTQKFFVVLVTGLVLVSIYSALKRLFGEPYALLTVFLISVEPFYVGLSRVFHLEGLLSTFMLASALWLYVYLTEQDRRYFIYSCFFGGLAVLTKTSALYLVPFFGLGTLIYRLDDGKKFGVALTRSIKETLLAFVMMFLVFFALWPALWVDFSGVMANLYRGITSIGVEGDHYQLYFGSMVEDPGFSYYFVVLLLRCSPYLLAGIIGYLLINKKLDKGKYGVFPLYMFLYSSFYIVQHTLPTKKLDRYILPALIGFLPIAGIYFEFVLSKLSVRKKVVRMIFIMFPILILLRLHPDYLSYYNPIFGGLRVGSKILEPKWLIGKDEIISFFEQIQTIEKYSPDDNCGSFECVINDGAADEVLSVGFPEKYATQIYPFFLEIGGWATIKDLTPFAKNTNYFVYPIWQDDSNKEDRFDIEYIDSINVRGVPLYNVYKRI